MICTLCYAIKPYVFNKYFCCSLSSKSSNRQQPTSKNTSNNTSNSASVSHSTETVKNCIDTKSSVVPSLQAENSEEEKATYETSV